MTFCETIRVLVLLFFQPLGSQESQLGTVMPTVTEFRIFENNNYEVLGSFRLAGHSPLPLPKYVLNIECVITGQIQRLYI